MSQQTSPFTSNGLPNTTTGEVPVDPITPKVIVKPGIQTSQGIFTGLATVFAFLLSFLGFHYTPSQIQNVSEGIVHLGTSLGPLVALVPILTNYINSRGKTTSNALLFNAQLQNPLVMGNNSPSPLMAQGLLGGGSGLNSILGQLAGGSGIKDPKTIIGLAKLVGSLVPGGAVVEKTLDKVGIGGSGSGASASSIDPQEIKDAFEQLVDVLKTQQATIKAQGESLSSQLNVITHQQTVLLYLVNALIHINPVLRYGSGSGWPCRGNRRHRRGC
jgi:hypothetical protein